MIKLDVISFQLVCVGVNSRVTVSTMFGKMKLVWNLGLSFCVNVGKVGD